MMLQNRMWHRVSGYGCWREGPFPGSCPVNGTPCKGRSELMRSRVHTLPTGKSRGERLAALIHQDIINITSRWREHSECDQPRKLGAKLFVLSQLGQETLPSDALSTYKWEPIRKSNYKGNTSACLLRCLGELGRK